MKKLLVLMLVLGMSAVSSAGLILEDLGGSIGVNTDMAIGGYDLACRVQAGEAGGDLALGGVVFNPELTWDFAGKMVGVPTAAQARMTASQFFGAPQGPGNLFTMSYTGAGWVDLLQYNAGGQETLVTSVLVPEPVSLMLLGLGGLFLRRRK